MSTYNSPENLAYVKSIAETLEAYAAGEIYEDESGNRWRLETSGERYESEEHAGDFWQYDEAAERWERTTSGETMENDPADVWEQCDMWQYFDEGSVFDIEYRTGSKHETPRSVCVMVACGGPNIYIDTEAGAVELYWWGDRAYYPLTRAAVEAVEEYFIELWDC